MISAPPLSRWLSRRWERQSAIHCNHARYTCRGRNASGLRYREYWAGTLQPRPTGKRQGWVTGLLAGAPACAHWHTSCKMQGGQRLRCWTVCGIGEVRHMPVSTSCTSAVDWYLDRVQQAVEAAKRATDGAPLTLLAHSAGGWLGRWVVQGGSSSLHQRMSTRCARVPKDPLLQVTTLPLIPLHAAARHLARLPPCPFQAVPTGL